jgi:hypothetical protein
VVGALKFIFDTFPEVELHNQLAILVPDGTFRDTLRACLDDALEAELPSTRIAFVDAIAGAPSKTRHGNEAQRVVLDTLRKFDGMERLFVLAVGLDTPAGCSHIYRALTRAYMFAAVVQERLDGGWLEFTLKTTLDEQPFDHARESERIVRANPVADMPRSTAAAAAVSMRAVCDDDSDLKCRSAAKLASESSSAPISDHDECTSKFPFLADVPEPLTLSAPPRSAAYAPTGEIVQGAWNSNNITCADVTSTGFYLPFKNTPALKRTDELSNQGERRTNVDRPRTRKHSQSCRHCHFPPLPKHGGAVCGGCLPAPAGMLAAG